MSFMVDPIGRYVIVQPHGYIRGGSVIPKTEKPATGFAALNALATTAPEGTLAQALSLLGRKTAALTQALRDFSFPKDGSTAGLRSVTVSDTDKAAASVHSGATIRTYRLHIDKIATAGTVLSSVLEADSPTDIPSGTHTFTLSIGGENRTLSITVNSATDTTSDVLARLGRVIESADGRLQADIVEGSRRVYSQLPGSLYEATVQLRVQARETGADGAFTLTDAEGGTLISSLHLDRIAAPAADAAYRLDDSAGTSASNTITADNALLQIELRSPTGGEPVSISVSEGDTQLVDKVADIIQSFNSYMTFLDDHSRYFDSALYNGLARDVGAQASLLAAIGLQPTVSGRITVTPAFAHAVQTNISAVQSAITGADGLFTMLEARLSPVLAHGAAAYARAELPPERAVGFSVFA